MGGNGKAVGIESEKNILDSLEFITESGIGAKGNPRWNLFLYPSLMRIPEADYETISARLS